MHYTHESVRTFTQIHTQQLEGFCLLASCCAPSQSEESGWEEIEIEAFDIIHENDGERRKFEEARG